MNQPRLTPTQARLNEALAQFFTNSECWGGYLQMQPTPQEVLYGARGYHESGKKSPCTPSSRP